MGAFNFIFHALTSLLGQDSEDIEMDDSDIEEVDLDGDGDVDAVGIDTDGDGNIDTMAVDSDNDGEMDTIAIDSDGDGRIDQMAYDSDGDGVIDSEVSEENAVEESPTARVSELNREIQNTADPLQREALIRERDRIIKENPML